MITNVVGRMQDPAGIVAADGTIHRSEALLAHALRALVSAATSGRAPPEAVAVAYPAHWHAATIDALRDALRRVTDWSTDRLALLSDAAAALVALRVNPACPPTGSSSCAISGQRIQHQPL